MGLSLEICDPVGPLRSVEPNEGAVERRGKAR
jgi:hypothetical protein